MARVNERPKARLTVKPKKRVAPANGQASRNGAKAKGRGKAKPEPKPRRKPRRAERQAGECVRLAREHYGLTQCDLAESLGFNQSTISLVERGFTDQLSRGNMLLLALFLRIKPGVFDPWFDAVPVLREIGARGPAHRPW